MGSLAKTLLNLAQTTTRLIDRQATDSCFVLRATKTPDGRGQTVKTYAATTTTALPCFYAVLSGTAAEMEAERVAQKRPVVYRRLVLAAAVDVTPKDRLRLVARGDVPQLDLEIVRVAALSGVMKEVIVVEEVAA